MGTKDNQVVLSQKAAHAARAAIYHYQRALALRKDYGEPYDARVMKELAEALAELNGKVLPRRRGVWLFLPKWMFWRHLRPPARRQTTGWTSAANKRPQSRYRR